MVCYELHCEEFFFMVLEGVEEGGCAVEDGGTVVVVVGIGG